MSAIVPVSCPPRCVMMLCGARPSAGTNVAANTALSLAGAALVLLSAMLLLLVVAFVLLLICCAIPVIALMEADQAFRPVAQTRTGRAYRLWSNPSDEEGDHTSFFQVVLDGDLEETSMHLMDANIPNGTPVAVDRRVGWSGHVYTSDPIILSP